MEVHGRQPEELRPSKDQFAQSQERLLESNRIRARRARELREGLAEVRQESVREARAQQQAQELQEARERLAEARQDRVELSEAAKSRASARDSEALSARVSELKDAHERGALNTPERIERSADNLLRG